ncbi:carboxymuconolactone decarboxylase family protein [Haliea sp. E1-2-M8]|uniref:carboxymuconolactone decarboxylase family protein n=1 Tax=Haliea sp. E1-2-M8 TaxID=3064706 RepID=UPI002723ADE2|nr:carboxymuconolactone decarboxylase family protein [Haliea sp. E1-2-M8]MDO8860468.1 carboxymuconolactone decarboxylase family protein [Haliea sp. E1-2-M8]
MTSAARVSPPAGNTGNVIRDSALGIVPETLDHYLALNAAIWDAGPLSAAEVELARLRNARHTGCVLCQAVRYDVAIADGLTEDKVQVIRQDDPAAQLSERERLIVAFVDQYNLDPAGIPAQLQQDLLAAFREHELLHLSLLVAWFNGSSRCAVALGGMPEAMPRLEISVPR